MGLSAYLSLLFFLLTGLMACKSGIQNVMPEIRDADSATIIYYDNPPDDRFFKVVKGLKTAELGVVIKDVNESVRKETKASCQSIGKIYFYKGTEQVYIVYFSDEICSKLALIKNGQRYESKMSEASFKLINKLQSKAKEPAAR